MTIDYQKHYSDFSVIRDAFVNDFVFLKADNYFTEFLVQEDLSSLGMGYRIFIVTEDIIISLSISKLERSAIFKICRRDSKLSIDWCVLRSEFSATEFFNVTLMELSSNFNDIKKYLKNVSGNLSEMLSKMGVDAVLAKLN